MFNPGLGLRAEGREGGGGREGPSSQPTSLHPRERGCKLKSRLRKEPRERGGWHLFNQQSAAAANESRFSRTPGHAQVERHQKTSTLPCPPPTPIAPPRQWGGGGVKPSDWGTSRSASPTPPFRDGSVPQGHGHTIPSIDESARPRGLLLSPCLGGLLVTGADRLVPGPGPHRPSLHR